MNKVLELARFRVREENEPAFLERRGAMVDAIASRFPALSAIYLAKLDDGTWVDVVLWDSRAEMERAGAEVMELPEVSAWMSLISDEGGMEFGALRHAAVPSQRTAVA